MPNKNNKARRRQATRAKPNLAAEQLNVSKQILAANKAQQVRPEMTVPDVPRMLIKRYKVHTIQCKINLSALTAQYGVIYFDASDIPDMASWGNVFDQFRIAQASVDFYANTVPIQICTAFDYTDIQAPTSFASLLDSETSYVCDDSYFGRTWSPVYQLSNAATGDDVHMMSGFMPIFSIPGTLNINTWGTLKYAYVATPATDTPYLAIATLVVSFRSSD